MNKNYFQVIRIRQVCALTGLSRSSIYAKLSAEYNKRSDPTFPRPFKLGPAAIGWSQAEVEAWIRARILNRSVKCEN